MEPDVDSECIGLLADEPWFCESPIEISPEHCTEVISCERWMEFFVPSFSMPCIGAQTTRSSNVC